MYVITHTKKAFDNRILKFNYFVVYLLLFTFWFYLFNFCSVIILFLFRFRRVASELRGSMSRFEKSKTDVRNRITNLSNCFHLDDIQKGSCDMISPWQQYLENYVYRNLDFLNLFSKKKIVLLCYFLI